MAKSKTRGEALRPNDITTASGLAADALAARFSLNANKKLEHGGAGKIAPAFIAAMAAHRHASRDSDPPRI